MEPARQVELGPPFDLVRSTDPARLPIDWPAEPHADSLERLETPEFSQGGCDLFTNAGGAPLWIDRKLPSLSYFAFRVAKHELQLRAANFNTEEHAWKFLFGSWFLRLSQTG